MKRIFTLLLLLPCFLLVFLTGCADTVVQPSADELLRVELPIAEYGKVFPEKDAKKLPYFYQVTVRCNPEINTYSRSALDMTEDSKEVETLKQSILETYLQIYSDNFSEIDAPTTDLIEYTPAELVLID